MKNNLVKKLTIIIESTNYKNISGDVMQTIYDLQQAVAPNPELKLSLITVNENNKSEVNADVVSPANWDYWQV